jgi:hypothetical protein
VTHDRMVDIELPEPTGTFECPICRIDHPHAHTDAQEKAYREEQLRGQFQHGSESKDGWNRIELKQPKERGWYLCRGIEIPADQFGKPKDIWDHHPRWSQLSWFNWVRSGGMRGWSENEIPEVLFFDPIYGGWQLRNLLGNAVVSGAESRHRVTAYPKYWRELPGFTNSGGSEHD